MDDAADCKEGRGKGKESLDKTRKNKDRGVWWTWNEEEERLKDEQGK